MVRRETPNCSASHDALAGAGAPTVDRLGNGVEPFKSLHLAPHTMRNTKSTFLGISDIRLSQPIRTLGG